MTIRPALALALSMSVTPADAAQRWSVDYAKSKLGFTVTWSGEPFTAVFRSWKADIDFDPADLAHSHATISIDLSSETSSDSETDTGIKGAEGFATSQFPTATFRTTGFAHKGGNHYVAAATLSVKGVTRKVTLPFMLTLSGNMAHVAGKAQIVRTDFQVGTGEWAKPDPVAQSVTVTVDLAAKKGS